jgi:ankyrin repeat protein
LADCFISEMATHTFKAGDVVNLHALCAEQFNGCEGRIVSGPHVDGRYMVRVQGKDEEKSSSTKKLKPDNLELKHRPANSGGASDDPHEMDRKDSGIEKWKRAQEEEVARNPPPKFYDEDLGPEYAESGSTPSLVFSAQGKDTLEMISLGVDSNVSYLVETNEHSEIGIKVDFNRDHPHSGLTPLIYAALKLDIPMVKAILRTGADVDFKANDRGPALHAICARECGFWRGERRTASGRSARAVVEFLLSIGADPSVADAKGQTPLMYAASVGDLDLAEAILSAPLGDRAMAGLADAARMAKEKDRKGFWKVAKAVKQRFEGGGAQRPVRRCPCGSGRLPADCHDRKGGVPAHPRQLCPCDPNKEKMRRGDKCKTYARCCLKRGHYFRESLTQVYPPPIIYGLDTEMGKLTLEHKKRMIAEGKDPNKPLYGPDNVPTMDGGTPSIFGNGVSGEMMVKMQLKMHEVVFAQVGRECDPAYAWATMRCDFYAAKPFALFHRQLPKGEKEKRQAEWNELIDRYIAERPGGDRRPALEIEKATKVSWRGGPLYHQCGSPACDKVEGAPGDFACCSACKVTRYCSKACAKAAWRVCHKADCGKPSGEPRLKSEVAVTTAMNELMSER